jgi:hypothetical protein
MEQELEWICQFSPAQKRYDQMRQDATCVTSPQFEGKLRTEPVVDPNPATPTEQPKTGGA